MAEPKAKKDVLSKLGEVFDGLVKVRVVTVIGTVDLDPEDGTPPKPPAKGHEGLETVVDLVGGDTRNVISTGVLTEHAELRDFHATQVEAALKVLPANIGALIELGRFILDRPEGD